ncbi:sporulation integral membrane protein YtvI [Anaerocolumna cellulosilytica]|uniref:Sporulation integral membrane protein YtvI n=1 Tax=Anaerocolumna cellulosilytica TaxID=433286 RepID=A0A6S6R1F1_9FIRM|nr:sporulation integral membrane protein YtvI [Anaerocolumna cellulosilytica]MBB5197984.1 sporulation integral membrane protein YtvI [Anaerocolumna cellulosilytica]BCJ93130.1 sporulation integral membrane protein YtvI [Anaerocolumna cellulosilytica]
MNIEKQKAFLIRFVYIALILGLVFISLKYVMPLLMPFVIGLIVAAFLRPIIDVISAKLHIKRPIVSILILLIFYGVLVFLAVLAGARVFSYLQTLFPQIPTFYKESLEPAFDGMTNDLLNRFPELEVYLEEIFTSINQSILEFLTKVSQAVLGVITGFAGQVPTMLINLIFTIVSTFFFTIDYHRIVNFVLRQFAKEKRNMILLVKDNVIGTLGKFIRAYTVLIFITFFELSLGFIILRIPNALLIGLIVAIVDILPILGTGAVLLPWCMIAFIFGNNSMGIGILILYIIITVVRQTLEPRVVGQQIGLHPVVTLICIFVGAKLLGVVGIFLFPVTATIVKKLNDEGSIHLFK